MKKLLFILLVLFSFIACGQHTVNCDNTSDSISIDTTIVVDSLS